MCTTEDRLGAVLAESELHDVNGVITVDALSQACRSPGYVAQVDVVATSGPCVLLDLELLDGGFQTLPFDAGVLTFEGGTAGVVELPPADATNCQRLQLPVDGAFATGEPIAFTASGGADFPPISTGAIAPEDLTLTIGPVNAGEPLVIAWDPPPPPVIIMMATPSGHSLFCQPVEPSELVIPGAMTALFAGGSPPYVTFWAERISLVEVDLGAGPGAFVGATKLFMISVPFSP